MKLLLIHPDDSVAVALEPIEAGETGSLDEKKWIAAEPIPSGHKMCVRPISKGESVIKYGSRIGIAKADIAPGEHVHTHNLSTALDSVESYDYTPVQPYTLPDSAGEFLGYVRSDGSVGIRNELWILPTVGCVNSIARIIEKQAASLVGGEIGAVRAFVHPYGCSQLSEDHKNTQKALAGLVRHPNACGVLVLGLGCENNNIDQFKTVLGEYDSARVRFLNCQESTDEVSDALSLLSELAEYGKTFRRERVSASKLTVGLKCGGSDGFSGITANPLVGRFSDLLISAGGSTILTEVPEMFGAETILMNRCKDLSTFQKTVHLINDYKEYFIRHGQVVYENPSPGNKAGGITTLEEKSLGCTQKGGSAQVKGVLSYGAPLKEKGLNLLSAPGNDLVASTALAVSGAQLVLFTTGRGTPFGCPVPTVKISSNTPLFEKKQEWIDFNAGSLLEGESMENKAKELFSYVLSLASGQILTRTEEHNIYDIAIFKDGVTL